MQTADVQGQTAHVVSTEALRTVTTLSKLSGRQNPIKSPLEGQVVPVGVLPMGKSSPGTAAADPRGRTASSQAPGSLGTYPSVMLTLNLDWTGYLGQGMCNAHVHPHKQHAHLEAHDILRAYLAMPENARCAQRQVPRGC